MDKKPIVLVCVTPQESSKNIVRAGKLLAEKNSAKLEIISVLPLAFNDKRSDPKIIEEIYNFAKEENGEMSLYFSDEPVFTIAAHIGKIKPVLLVTGFPGEDSNGLVSTIRLLIPELPISMVDGDKVYNMLPFESNQFVK